MSTTPFNSTSGGTALDTLPPTTTFPRLNYVLTAATEPNANGLMGIRGILILEGTETGDQRFIDPDALTWENGPWPLMAQIENTGHDGAPLVGRIDNIFREGGNIRFDGVLNAERGGEAADLIEQQMLRGISADLDSAEVEFRKDDGTKLTDDNSFEEWASATMVITSARVRGGTILPMPAFSQTELELYEASAATASIVASVKNDKELPPVGWFGNPDLQGPTPLTITDDGHVFGHIALWDTCHVGIKGVCATPPNSETEYAFFTRNAVKAWCDECGQEEEMATGPITAGLGHASLRASKTEAVAHYDDITYGVADVSAGEDAHGIWVAGRIRPTATLEQIENLRGSSVSGDWRRINGNLELIAILAVNTPGYPIKRERALAHVASLSVDNEHNMQTSLISKPYGNTDRLEKLETQLSKLTASHIKVLKDFVNKS